MKLAYITNARIPSERANAMQTAQMCAAFAAAGAEVTLYYPDRRNLPQFSKTDVWAYYNLPRNFEVCPIPCIDLFHLSGGRTWLERPIFLWQTLTFATTLVSLLRRHPADLYYSRDPFVLALMIMAVPGESSSMLFEAHGLPVSRVGRAFRRWALSRVKGTVVISEALKRLHVESLGLAPESVLTAHDGVDIRRFAPQLDPTEARDRLGLPRNGRWVVYTGGLYAGRGIEELIMAIKEIEAILIVVGGADETSLKRFRRFAAEYGTNNVRFEGYLPPTDIPLYLAAADILAMPYSQKTIAPGGITTDWMSPLKMFEYLAAGRAIVATDLPVLREVLRGGENALLVPPDDAVALTGGLKCLLADVPLRQRLATQAAHDAETYTWDGRAKAILEFAKS